MADRTCTHCHATGLEPGFLSDFGQGAQGFAKWVEGPLERGVFGGPKKLMSRAKWEVDAYRCPRCGHLELFAERLS